MWYSLEAIRNLKTSLNSALLTTCHRGESLFLYNSAIPSSPNPVSLCLVPLRRSFFSNSPTQRESHFQICTKTLASRVAALSFEAGIIFHIFFLRKLRLSKAKCLAQVNVISKDRSQTLLYLAFNPCSPTIVCSVLLTFVLKGSILSASLSQSCCNTESSEDFQPCRKQKIPE